jgi:hypothetical protein
VVPGKEREGEGEGIGGLSGGVWGEGVGKEGERRGEQYGSGQDSTLVAPFKGVSSTKFFFFFFEQKTPYRCVLKGKRIKDQGLKSLHGCFLSSVLWCTVVY